MLETKFPVKLNSCFVFNALQPLKLHQHVGSEFQDALHLFLRLRVRRCMGNVTRRCLKQYSPLPSA